MFLKLFSKQIIELYLRIVFHLYPSNHPKQLAALIICHISRVINNQIKITVSLLKPLFSTALFVLVCQRICVSTRLQLTPRLKSAQ